MKILAVCGTSWMEQLVHSWEREHSCQLHVLRVPPRPISDPSHLGQAIRDCALRTSPDFVLDVNGFGVLPVKGSDEWTVDAVKSKWVEWWFNEPACSARGHVNAGGIEGFAKVLERPNVRNFIWDAVLATEYSKWTSSRWVHLPAGTDPDAFKPVVKPSSRAAGGRSEVFFIGNSFDAPSALEESGSLRDAVDYAASRRLNFPAEDYFTMAAAEDAPPRLKELFRNKAGSGLSKAFETEMIDFRFHVNAALGVLRMKRPLGELSAAFNQERLGLGKLEEVNANYQKGTELLPEIASQAAASDVALDFGCSHGFTGIDMRVYDMMACGALVAFQSLPDFDPKGELEGRAYLRFSSPLDLSAQLKGLRQNPSREASIRNEARAYVAGRHAWKQRFGVIMEWL